MNLRPACARLAKAGTIYSALSPFALKSPSRIIKHPGRLLLSPFSRGSSRDASTFAELNNKSSLKNSVIGLLCIASASAAFINYETGIIQANVSTFAALISDKIGFLKAKVADGNGTVSMSADGVAHRLELDRILKQAIFYEDKNQDSYRQALGRLTQFMDEHPELVDPVSTFGFAHREVYLRMLGWEENHPDIVRTLNALIIACRRRLDHFDQLGHLNLPLQRDVILFPEKLLEHQQRSPNAVNLTELEERKFVFQQLFRAYDQLLVLYLAEDSPPKRESMFTETVEDLLTAIEAEYGTSYDRLPTRGRGGEIDKVFLFNYLSSLRQGYEMNTLSTYSAGMALKCLRPIIEIWPSVESILELTPCQKIYDLQIIAELVLDLACESTPDGLLTTTEERRHLAEAREIQQRVLELGAAIEPAKRDNSCTSACSEGLISMAKIAWRYGEEEAGDKELEKALILAEAVDDHLLKEVIRRIDKHPSKTSMKYWEPVDQDECERLRALDSEDEDDNLDESESDQSTTE